MSATSKIEWTDSTFNPWIGCTRVSPACDHCYAAVSTPARSLKVQWGTGHPRHRTAKKNWDDVEKWNRKPFVECDRCGWRGEHPPQIDSRGLQIGLSRSCPNCPGFQTLAPARRRVFCASLADWLDNEVPIEWLVDLLDLIRRTPNLDWLLLTKRIGNWNARVTGALGYIRSLYRALPLGTDIPGDDGDFCNWMARWLNGTPPANVWLGATVVNQAEADRDVPKLLAVPTRIRFLSIEPMLGPVDLTHMDVEKAGHREWCWINALTSEHTDMGRPCPPVPRLHWVICGGESGHHARPMHPDWARSLRDQCAAAGVPFLFKQWGEWSPGPFDADTPQNLRLRGGDRAHFFADGTQLGRVGKVAAGRMLDGRTWDGVPEI